MSNYYYFKWHPNKLFNNLFRTKVNEQTKCRNQYLFHVKLKSVFGKYDLLSMKSMKSMKSI